MKRILLISAALLLTITSTDLVYGQNKTIVLVRHGEKDVSTTASKNDPDLSAEGRSRALRLRDLLKPYKPHEIFSTNFKRTRQTVEPIASYRKKDIQTYSPSDHAELVKKIMASKTDHNLIVGHSNTIPLLVNLFVGKQVFRELPDSEYGVYYVIRLKTVR